MTDTIQYSQSDGIGRLTLNHPERHNSLGREQLDALGACVEQVAQDTGVRVLIVTGAGDKTFCAGASLTELGAGALADDAFQATMAKLAALSVPTICALNGSVFGGGVELAASCDFRVGVEGMRMRVPAASLGLCYPLEGIRRFVECVGPRVARRILVAAEEFDTAGLVAIGFLDNVVEREALEPTVTALAERIAGLAPLAVQSMNEVLRQMAAGELDGARADELVARCLHSRDLQEGLAAQREKRKPVFEGR
ncbi:MAG: enoyl-CoA hydratase-related protein [Halioglobus sp.]|nr:enoyl-CoA hydratase-related protein [Halioglobus sp.]